MAKKICKDCAGRGWIAGPLYAMEGSYKCPTCKGTGAILRTGPYRLADGTWSDGVDRSVRLGSRPITHRFEVTRSDWEGFGWFVEWLTGEASEFRQREFPTFAEAIAYADKQARTTKNGDNNA